MDSTLTADVVRGRLADALTPVLAEADAALARYPVCDPNQLRIVVQLHPLVVQITQVPDEGKRARSLVAFGGHRLPDGGVELAAAAEQFAAGVLSALPKTGAAEAVVLNAAAATDGGLVILFNPSDSTAVLIVAESGKSLGEGFAVGGIGETETTH